MTKIVKIGRMIYKILESDNILVSVNIDTKVYNLILFSTKKNELPRHEKMEET